MVASAFPGTPANGRPLGTGPIPSPGEDASPVRLDTIETALGELAAGRPVAVVDDAARENEGDLVLAAEHATAERIAFMVRHTSGLLCAPMPASWLDRVALPPMTSRNEDPKQTAYSVTVDAAAGVTTGISAADRARTLQVLANPDSTAADLRRPGHVLPLRAAEQGVFTRAGHTEATTDLARLAGCAPVGVIGELVDDDTDAAPAGRICDAPATRAFCDQHGLAMISIAELIAYRYQYEPPLHRGSSVRLPIAVSGGAPVEFTATAFTDVSTGDEHLAVVLGDPSGRPPALVRVHSECLTGDVFGSRRCDCGPQLHAALARIAAVGCGAVIYLRGHEGRGIGLAAKLEAYALQQVGRDTVQANVELGLPVDARTYHAAAAILAKLGIRRVELITNNPAKVAALSSDGIDVTGTVAVPTPVTGDNVAYLTTKRDRLGHTLALRPDERIR